jgi:hypothetical protein
MPYPEVTSIQFPSATLLNGDSIFQVPTRKSLNLQHRFRYFCPALIFKSFSVIKKFYGVRFNLTHNFLPEIIGYPFLVGS